MRLTQALQNAGLALILLFPAGCGKVKIRHADPYNHQLKVEGDGWRTSPLGNRYIGGTLVNGADSSYGRVMIDIALYDAAGKYLGNTYAGAANVAPGARVPVDAFFIQKGVASYKIKGASSW